MPDTKIRVVHIITGLNTGGAENMLYKLLSAMDNNFENIVISLMDKGVIGAKIEQLGVKVLTCDMLAGKFSLMAIYRLFKHLKNTKPTVVQTWLYHADLLGGVIAKLLGCKNIIWNIRTSNLNKDKCNTTTIWVIKICAYFSKFIPKKIICNSKNSIIIHQKLGYSSDKFVFIANGFDTNKLIPIPNANKEFKQKFNLPQKTQLVGIVARFDPQKNHQGFLQMASFLMKKKYDINFIMVGNYIDKNNKKLQKLIRHYKLEKHIILLGEQQNIADIMSVLDILVSTSSFGEAFPNVLGEAMSCATPSVATDVGDCREIINDNNRIVAVDDMYDLANKVGELLIMDIMLRNKIGQQDRQRVIEYYSLDKIINQYQKLYQ